MLRKLLVLCVELPSTDGNCLIYNDTDEDWLEQPSSFFDLLTLPPPPTHGNIDQSTNQLQTIFELKQWVMHWLYCRVGFI